MKIITVVPNYLSALGLSAPVLETKLFRNLTQGSTFQLEVAGDVFVRCHGGFRSGRGGPLIKLAGTQPVYIDPEQFKG